MEKYKVDVPVLLIFFTRDDTFAKVFEKVREAKPSKLFLACDGPRANRPDDVEKIEKCKAIASNIDWECEVYTNYSDVNLGCGVRPQSAIGWALSIVDRIVILEDDCVPELSFFDYMAELLERYKDDERVGMVSGLNHLKTWDCGGYDYCFTKNGAIWGWGTWSRVWKEYDYTISHFNNEYTKKLLHNSFRNKNAAEVRERTWTSTVDRLNKGENISYWDVQFGFLKHVNSYFAIVPRNNLIYNIGVGADSTHAIGVTQSSWKKGTLHFIPTAEIEQPLKHPPYVLQDVEYDMIVDKYWLGQSRLRKNFGRIKRVIKRIFFKK